MKIDPREKVSHFMDHFDNVVREYHSFEGVVRLSTEEIRSAFYNAIAGRSSELRQAVLTFRAEGQKPLTIEEMRTLLLQSEAEIKSETRRTDYGRSDNNNADLAPYDPTVYASATYKPRRGNEDRCNRCNLDGHHAYQCPLIPLGLWFCCVCRKDADHIGRDCPMKHRVHNKLVHPKSSKNTPHSHGKQNNSRRSSWAKGRG
ncbi:hypothetical protein QAD02_013586 [Eretmocerus hayati]|uniref:Uncharacterized protein n=1 Tax=Eretmocerus hayati TaxID=131215 RepID=A0ACC2P2J7_9HYME|nr:hypothetical protein QAD02_013586 [Eretmocerus hayati]